MQNRESAVRSRMRKTCYQEVLEEKLHRLEKITKEISDKNVSLQTQNQLFKKQIAYFEDIFAKSSLIGFENLGNGIKKNDLE